MSKFTKTDYIVVDRLDGAIGQELHDARMPKIYSIKEFCRIVKSAIQFDWGDFYLFPEKTEAEVLVSQILKMKVQNSEFYQKTVVYSLATIRAFDSTSFIIYTNKKEIMERIKEKYPDAKIENKTLEELEFYS
jgi:hypothetical protein